MNRPVGSSFRDPSGVVFRREDVVYRQVNPPYRDHYAALLHSGLYEELVGARLLVGHEEVDRSLALTEEAERVLRPDPVPFISHPYEWSFSMLKHAALTTLEIQRRALDRGMVLKDASAYNLQFVDGRPIFIDTLSFERYVEGRPWLAYRQFCQHFLIPLLLMTRVDVRLGELLRVHLDGIPLDLGSRLLPRTSWLRPSTAFHVHLHARSVSRHTRTDPGSKARNGRVSKNALRGLTDGLTRAVDRLGWSPVDTEWGEYEHTHGYTARERATKEELVDRALSAIDPTTVWDLGANVGVFSRIAAVHARTVVSIDGDPAAVERNYRRLRSEEATGILPLWIDIGNPSPSLGWAHEERPSLLDRGPVDALLALALIHHLAIGENVPLDRIARFLRSAGRSLVIEWVPKADPQVRRLLVSREDIFERYRVDEFEARFGAHFEIVEKWPIEDSGRVLYRMEGK